MRATPWGEIVVNDAHIHFFSHRFYSDLASRKKLTRAEELAALLDWEIPPPEETQLASNWVAEMNATGVARATLIASTHGDELSVQAAVAAYPDRFWGAFMLDPTQPDAIERVTAAAVSPHLHCLCLFPAMHTYSIRDSRIVPILELASDRQLAVFVHCGALSVGVRRRLALPSQFDMRYSDPLDLHAVALHFPKLRFIIPHFGAGLLRETLMLADLCPNVWLDTSSSNRWMAYDGLDLRRVFERSIAVVGRERLVFGTDSSYFPRGWHAAIFEAQAKALYELGLDQTDAEQIFRWNAERLYRVAA